MATSAPRCLAADQRCLASTACALPPPHRLCPRPRPALPPRRGDGRRSAAPCSSAHAQGAWSCRRRFAALVAHAQRGRGEPGEAEPVEPGVLPPGAHGPLPPAPEGTKAAPAPALASTGGRRAEAWAPASWHAGGRGAPWTALLGVGGASLAALAGAPAPAPPDPAARLCVTQCCVRCWLQLAPAARLCPAASLARPGSEGCCRRLPGAVRSLIAGHARSVGHYCAFATRACLVAAKPLASSGAHCAALCSGV
jgi:hypothetical protein